MPAKEKEGEGQERQDDKACPLQVYREEQDAWLGAVLARVAKNMRATALAADAENRKAGRKAATLENCGGSLQRVFASAIGGSESFPASTESSPDSPC